MKLPAGDLVIYPSSSLHRVVAVTRGARLASFFGIQSLIREDSQRRLLFELDASIQRLTQSSTDAAAVLHTDRRLSQPAAPVGRALNFRKRLRDQTTARIARAH